MMNNIKHLDQSVQMLPGINGLDLKMLRNIALRYLKAATSMPSKHVCTSLLVKRNQTQPCSQFLSLNASE